jgi:hypothetical protein
VIDAILELPGESVHITTSDPAPIRGTITQIISDHIGDPLAVVLEPGDTGLRVIIPWHAIIAIAVQ